LSTSIHGVRRRVGVLVGVCALFAGLAAMFLPPPSALRSTLPVGRTLVLTVPLFNVWTIWWNADRLQHGFRGYWDAPIFFPEEDAFAFSEPQPATLVVAPVIWLSGSRVLAYNAFLWLSLVLNGLVCVWLLRSLGHRWWLSILGGVGMLLLPLVHDQIDVLQLVPLWGILWTWGAIRRLGERPTPAVGFAAGMALGVSFAMSIHHGLFASILLVGPPLVLLRRWRSRQLYVSGLVGIGTAALVTLPLVLPMRAALAAHDFQRTSERVAGLSARPASYLAVGEQCLLRPQWVAGQQFRLSPGWGKSVLAGVALLALFVRRRRRRWTLFLVLTAAMSFALSLGPHLQLGSLQPWEAIRQWVPGMTQVRSVFRFAYFFQMAIVLLAVEGAHLLWVLGRWWPRRRRTRAMLGGLAIALLLPAAIETWPKRQELAGTPSAAQNRGWIEFVRDQTDRGRGIACLPFATGSSVTDFVETTRWMLLGTFHGVPLVNGYSGYFPASNEVLRELMAEGFFSTQALDHLEAAGTQFVVVRDMLIEDREGLDAAEFEGRLMRVFDDKRAGVSVYRLSESPAPGPPAAGEPQGR
jgi:hypothetical protein